MAVVNTSERFQQRRTSYNGKVWTANRSWLVETNSWNDAEDTISGAAGLPAYGALHPNPVAASMWAESISYAPVSDGTPMAWIVSVGYTSARQLDATNPENDEILTGFNAEIYQEFFNIDEDGKAVVNSAGDPFNPSETTRDEAHLVATIESNHQAVPTWVWSYLNAVNNSAVTIGGIATPMGKAKCGRISVGKRQKRGDVTFYPVQLEVHLHRKGWKFEPLDQGTHEILLGKRRRILSGADLEPVTEPVPLNGGGSYLEDPTPDTVVFGDFKQYPELDFTALPGIT